MRSIVFLVICLFSSILSSQSKAKFDISAYYSTKFASESINSLGQMYYIWDHYMNISLRYSITRRWIIGAEYMLSHIDGIERNNPFSLAGFFVDYDIFWEKDINYYFRIGLNRSNQLFIRDRDEPLKRLINNLSAGCTADLKLYRFLKLWGGFMVHYPLNKIKDKEWNVMPVLGVRFNI